MYGSTYKFFALHSERIGVFMNNKTERKYYSNPIGITGIGDPFILKAPDGMYFMYATSAADGIKAWKSDDMIKWESVDYIYHKTEKTWGEINFWAPEVIFYKNKYYLFYSASVPDKIVHRTGVATCNTPYGPFIDIFNRPMFDPGYAALDASPYINDDGSKYLYYSKDCVENVVEGRHESHSYVVEMNEDMTGVIGEPVFLTKPDEDWEKLSGPEWLWNEGQHVFKRNGIYYLMYSANSTADNTYCVGYATSDKPMGPFVKYAGNPILKSVYDDNGKCIISAPGHNSVTKSPDGNDYYIAYHVHTNPEVMGGDRQMFIDKMEFKEDGSIYIDGPNFKMKSYPC